MSDQFDVTVSIVSGGSAQLLADCLASLPRAAGSAALDVAVVDNAIGAPLDELAAAHPDVRWIRSPQRRGFGANHNMALAGSDARHLFVLNDDTVLGPSCIERLVGFMDRNPTVGCAGPRLVFADGRRQASAFRFPTPARVALTALTLERKGWVMSDTDRVRRVDWVHGAAMFVRAAGLPRRRRFRRGLLHVLGGRRPVPAADRPGLAGGVPARRLADAPRELVHRRRARAAHLPARAQPHPLRPQAPRRAGGGGRAGADGRHVRGPHRGVAGARPRPGRAGSLRLPRAGDAGPGGRPAVEDAAAEFNSDRAPV